MDAETSKTILEQALSRLLNEDVDTFGNTIGERTLMFRIAHYMANESERDGMTVDCEYNRHGDDFKRLPSKTEEGLPDKPKRLSPDIVLHKRKKDDNNILVCEIKKSCDKRNPLIDQGRLRQLTDPNGDFHYTLGAFITIDQAGHVINVIYFENGNLSSSFDSVDIVPDPQR